MKKRLSRGEEFDILKLVLDKILYLGFAISAYGMYLMYVSAGQKGFMVIITGIIFLFFFSFLLIKEYELIK
jgi:hypothetical protein